MAVALFNTTMAEIVMLLLAGGDMRIRHVSCSVLRVFLAFLCCTVGLFPSSRGWNCLPCILVNVIPIRRHTEGFLCRSCVLYLCVAIIPGIVLWPSGRAQYY